MCFAPSLKSDEGKEDSNASNLSEGAVSLTKYYSYFSNTLI